MIARSCLLPILCGMVLFSPRLLAEESLALFPPALSLTGREARQTFFVERMVDGRGVGVIEEGVSLDVADPTICRVEGSAVIPLANGQTTLRAQFGSASAVAEVRVSGMEHPYEWSFRHHVQSVLAKFGCNSGACHGAAAGKRGFKLSLRGYDAPGDYDVLLKQAHGRRVNLDEPAQSLLLTKATAAVPHGGGARFKSDSLEYRVIVDWIASGAPAPSDRDGVIESIEVFPSQVTLLPNTSHPLVVRAKFSDGHLEDVTRWAKYNSAAADVVDVDDQGRVKSVGLGEGAVSVWYANKIALATITVPYANNIDPALFAAEPRRNQIDELVLAKLAELRLPPSPLASDSEFLRRVWLDMTGTLPPPEEIRQFLADPSAGKRDAMIEKLLASESFVDFWTYKLSDILLVNSERLREPAMWAYYQWIRNNVSAGRPWDAMVRDLLQAEGSTLDQGATNFFVLHQDVRELTETVSVAFLGLSINCARCHNHPLERWTNDEYFGMANMLSRVRVKGGTSPGHFVVYAAREGDIVQPLRGKPQPPRPLDGEALAIDAPADRREALANWVTSPGNPYFARAIANRIWANFMGVGLVEAVDDLRLTNPPSHPALLQALADHLISANFDLRSLMRLVTQSATYQRTSTPLAENAGDRRFYSRYYPRRLMAEVAMDAISQATGASTNFVGYPPHWRAIQLPDSKVASAFLDKFGRPKRDATCECERTSTPSMVQALHLANGDLLHEKLKRQGNRIDQILGSGKSSEEMLDELYLYSASRFPSADEKRTILDEWERTPAPERRAFLEDLAWSILSSKEFLFNH
jgi:hypothetical protein